jgi:hypothetical protein
MYFRDGRLFAVPRNSSSSSIEYFWLCADCAEQLEIEFAQKDHGPTLVSRHDVKGLRHTHIHL